jgi:hypothetical protein
MAKIAHSATASGKDLSFTQVLFRGAGIPEAPNVENSNITMHQIMRLLYSDQQTPAKLFRFEVSTPAISARLLGSCDWRERI